MMKEVLFEIISNEALTKDVFRIVLSGDTSAITKPGQFVNIKIEGFFLRRPLSVCDCEGDRLTLVYKVTGEGTEALSKMQSGSLSILTGLGNGFDVSRAGDKPLLIGGGLGLTPLYLLAKKLNNPTVILGFNNRDEVVYEEEFKAIGAKVIVATADGSYGEKGFVTDAMKKLYYSYFYTCGPEAMFDAINGVAMTEGEFSFEERMGCGFGACMGCTCQTKVGLKRICKDGPVMKSPMVLSQE